MPSWGGRLAGRPAAQETAAAGPAADAPPHVITGIADVGQVQLYAGGSCNVGTPIGLQTNPGGFASPGISVGPFGPNTATATTALASYGDAASTCTGGFTYQVKPTAPSLTATSPVSGGNNNSPLIQGTTLPGTTIDLYSAAGCAGYPKATGWTEA